MTEKEMRTRDAQEQLQHNRYIRRHERRQIRKMNKQSMTSWILEFSKKVVVMCVLLHVAVFLFSAWMMWYTADASALSTAISESSEVLRTCVFGYMIKAGIENWQKIRKSKEDTKNNEGGIG